MTVTLQNVDNDFLDVLKSLVKLQSKVVLKEEKEPIKEEILNSIKSIKDGTFKGKNLDELKKELALW